RFASRTPQQEDLSRQSRPPVLCATTKSHPTFARRLKPPLRHMVPHVTAAPYDKLPLDAQRMRAWAFGQVKHWATNDNPFEGEELASLLARWTGAPYPFGDLPVMVLSRGRAGTNTTVEQEHVRNQAELLRLSRKSLQVIARR